jgi:hypothetical protein
MFIRFIYKTLLDEKKKEEKDGMQPKRASGRNASSIRLAYPPYLKVN